MTVNPITFYALLWAFLLFAFLAWYWQGKIVHANEAHEIQKRINVRNAQHHANIEAILIEGILTRANVERLPKLNSSKWAAIQLLYALPDFERFNIPAQITTDHDDRPTIYWKVTDVNQLTAYEIARLWLLGVL